MTYSVRSGSKFRFSSELLLGSNRLLDSELQLVLTVFGFRASAWMASGKNYL